MEKLSPEEIQTRLTKVVAESFAVDTTEVKPETDIRNDFGVDSLATIEFIMAVETEFNITIPDEDYNKLSTVKEIVVYLHQKL